MMDANELSRKPVHEIQALIENLARDPVYGCYTRPGLEYIVWPEIRQRARWIIFADMDGFHDLNEACGYDDVNERMQKALQLRKMDAAAAGRWFSGDELVWILCDTDGRPPTNPQLAARRLQKTFKKFGLSATFGISRVLSYHLAENVLPAYRLVQQAKKLGLRDTVKQTGKLDSRMLSRIPLSSPVKS